MYLLSGLLKQNGLFAHLAIITTAIVLDLVVLFTDLQTAIRFTCIAVLCSVRSPQALNNLLKCFPLSFSLGEAILVIQGSIMFFVTALANCYDETTASSTIFSQVMSSLALDIYESSYFSFADFTVRHCDISDYSWTSLVASKVHLFYCCLHCLYGSDNFTSHRVHPWPKSNHMVFYAVYLRYFGKSKLLNSWHKMKLIMPLC